ncbi:fetal and adult testis-expressed transcript protein [Lagenorhynchus albirostris]|uniref:fetal and adult testis-expressed transcript protein n=1 Tax=Lagenorhynchus albirostris TaxID=27610 RepID=UPI0028EAC750|nr:fetal and adult testis-expressed transcript protein [Lagenorhynchus albirostris]
MVAEIGLEELNGLEMEVMRRQLPVITGLRAVEDQGAAWRHREAVFFAMLLPTCNANLWLWMHQWCFVPTRRATGALPPSPSSLLSLGHPCPSSFQLSAAISQLCLREALAAGRWRKCGIPKV